jgi:hypothetical protein
VSPRPDVCPPLTLPLVLPPTLLLVLPPTVLAPMA